MNSYISRTPLQCPLDAPLYPSNKVEVLLEKTFTPLYSETPVVFIPGKNHEEEADFIKSFMDKLAPMDILNNAAERVNDFMLTEAILHSEPHKNLRKTQQTLLNISTTFKTKGSTLPDADILSLSRQADAAIQNLKENSGILNGAFYKVKEKLSNKKVYQPPQDLLIITGIKEKTIAKTNLVSPKQHAANMQLVEKLSIKGFKRVANFIAFAVEVGPSIYNILSAKTKEERRIAVSRLSDVSGENIAANFGTAAVVIVLAFTSIGAVTVISAGIVAGVAAGVYFGDDISKIIEPPLQKALEQIPLS